MRKFLVLLGLAGAIAGASYYWSFHRAIVSVAALTPDGTDAELAWLKSEFALTVDQYDKVLALHHAYSPVCAEYCTRYIVAHRRYADLLKTNTKWSPEMATAIAEQATIQSECHASMLKYTYDVAACMSAEQGRRYLEMIKLQLMEGDPAGMFAAAR